MLKPISFEKVSLAEAKRIHDGAPPAGLHADWSGRRTKHSDAERLDRATQIWMDELPADVRPVHLGRKFARIVNRVHALWQEPERCAHYLAELLIVKRSNRRGFSLAIAKEISKLALHHATIYPPARPWT